MANNLSASHATANDATIKSKCEPAQWEDAGKVVDVWDCDLRVLETNPEGELISSTGIRFAIPRDGEKRIIRGSLSVCT